MSKVRPYAPQKVAQAIIQRARRYCGHILSNGTHGVIIGLLNDFCGGDDGRYEVLEFLFGTASTKHLSDAQWFALKAWVDPHKELVGGSEIWCANPFVKEESLMICEAMGYVIDKKKE